MKSLNKPPIFRKNSTLNTKITVLTLVLTVNLSAHIVILFIPVHKKQSSFEIMYIYLPFFYLSSQYHTSILLFSSARSGRQVIFFFFIIHFNSHGVCDCDIWLALINHVLVITRFYWPLHTSIITSNLWCNIINWMLRYLIIS